MTSINIATSNGIINNLTALGTLTASKIIVPSTAYSGPFVGLTNPLILQNTQTFTDTSTAANAFIYPPIASVVLNSPTFNAINSSIQYNAPCTLYVDKPINGTNVHFSSGAFSLITGGGICINGNSIFNGRVNLSYNDIVSVQSITFVGGGNQLKVSGDVSTTATAGTAALPSAPAGFMNISIDNVSYKIPYYPA